MARLLLIITMAVCIPWILPLCLAHTATSELIADHERVDADGEVSNVTCSGVEMRLKIAAGNRIFRLHARDYTRVDISQDVPFQAGEFKPCTELGGKTAKITFVTVEHKTYDGEIQSIEVENPRQ
jgi:hypothetical protein